MNGQIDFKRIAEDLLSQARTLLPTWLPGGKLVGKEYVCGNVRGEPGSSLKVNTQTGVWKDFAGGEGGSDLISLYAAIYGIGQGEAARRLAASAPPSKPYVANGENSVAKEETTRAAAAADSATAVNFTMPPEGARPVFTGKFGKPTHVHEYKSDSGRTLFFIARYDYEGKKQFLPFTWAGDSWVTKSHPAPRPLYGLELLAARPNAPVLIVEGEKSADAARKFAGHVYVVVTWPGGSSAHKYADFSPIYGRAVLLWPDADGPGVICMRHVAEQLVDHCPEVKLLDVSDLEDGWDAADCGFGWSEFVAWAKPRAVLFEKPDVTEGPRPLARPLHVEQLPEVLPPLPEPPAHVTMNISAPEEMPDPGLSRFLPQWLELGLSLNHAGMPIVSIENAAVAMENWSKTKDFAWYDEFERRVLTNWGGTKTREWNKFDTIDLTVQMQRHLGLHRFSDDLVQKAVIHYAYAHRRNEIKEWLSSLKWDSIPRIDTFFELYFGAPNRDDIHAASKNFWISMAARVFQPGCKSDTMVILEGGQGTYKSTALSVIGGKWFAEASESVMSKDFYMILHGKLLVEVAEMDSFSKAEDSRIKQVLSSREDRFRAPYAATAEDHPRQGILAGTTNERRYLKDHTGARRFWPVPIGRIDIDSLRRDRDQFFAEAVHRYHQGDSWWEMPGSIKEQQDDRYQSDPWEDPIYDYLEGTQQTHISTDEIYTKALNGNLDKLSRAEGNRIAKIMHRIRWDYKTTRYLGRYQKRWYRPDNADLN